MARVHISPRTKRPARCRANPEKGRGCPYGDDSPHFSSMEEAYEYQAKEAEKEHNEVPKTSSKKKTEQKSIRSSQKSHKSSSLRPLSEMEKGVYKAVVEPAYRKQVNDSLTLLENPHKHLARHLRDSVPEMVYDKAMEYDEYYRRLSENLAKKEKIEWRGRNAESEEKKEAYRQEWRRVNRAVNQSREDFCKSEREVKSMINFFKSNQESINNVVRDSKERERQGESVLPRMSKAKIRDAKMSLVKTKTISQLIDSGTDSDLRKAAEAYGDSSLRDDVEDYISHRQKVKNQEKTLRDIRVRQESATNPEEKRALEKSYESETKWKLMHESKFNEVKVKLDNFKKIVDSENRRCHDVLEISEIISRRTEKTSGNSLS